MYLLHVEMRNTDKVLKKNHTKERLDEIVELFHRYIYGAKYNGYVIENISIHLRGDYKI